MNSGQVRFVVETDELFKMLMAVFAHTEGGMKFHDWLYDEISNPGDFFSNFGRIISIAAFLKIEYC